MRLVARHVHLVVLLLHRGPYANIPIDPLSHVVFVELLARVIYVQDLWHALIWDVCMGYNIVDHVALNSKWIFMTLYGILNPTNSSMLPPFAWGKVVMFHCFASNIMELVLEFLCYAGQLWSSQKESLSCNGVVGDINLTSMNLHEFVEVFACMISADGHKWDGVLGHRNVALFQFSPCFWVVNLECKHVCHVAWPESLVLDPIIAKNSLLSAYPTSR